MIVQETTVGELPVSAIVQITTIPPLPSTGSAGLTATIMRGEPSPKSWKVSRDASNGWMVAPGCFDTYCSCATAAQAFQASCSVVSAAAVGTAVALGVALGVDVGSATCVVVGPVGAPDTHPLSAADMITATAAAVTAALVPPNLISRA